MKLDSTLIVLEDKDDFVNTQKLLFSKGLKWASGGQKIVKDDYIKTVNIFYRDMPLILKIIFPFLWFKSNGLCIQSLDKGWVPYYYDLKNKDKPKIDGHTNLPFKRVFYGYKELEDYLLCTERKLPEA